LQNDKAAAMFRENL